jgi:hypothetical protein
LDVVINFASSSVIQQGVLVCGMIFVSCQFSSQIPTSLLPYHFPFTFNRYPLNFLLQQEREAGKHTKKQNLSSKRMTSVISRMTKPIVLGIAGGTGAGKVCATQEEISFSLFGV